MAVWKRLRLRTTYGVAMGRTEPLYHVNNGYEIPRQIRAATHREDVIVDQY